MNHEIIEKFFNNQTTPEETQKVLDWFETAEGQQYLQNRLDVDSGLMDRKELQKMVPELDSDRIYSSIQQRIRKRNVFSLKRKDWLGYAVKAVAAVLVIFTASYFTIAHQQYLAEKVIEREAIVFQTEGEQHREITLGDGTVVRMNSNTELVISEDFMQGTREIYLNGEAYFEVTHNPEQPFIIHANQSAVEVLGTAFNVRSLSGQDNVQVAVVEGRVSFKNTSQNNNQLAVILSKGQYGYMNISDRTLLVDDKAVENYLAWKNGRLIFNELTLQQVCTQMNRLYEVNCSFENEEIKNLQLTANFSNESLEKTLSVISLSLKIDYEKDENIVHWSHQEAGTDT